MCSDCIMFRIMFRVSSVSISFSVLGIFFVCRFVSVSVLNIMNLFCGIKIMWVMVNISISVSESSVYIVLFVSLLVVRMGKMVGLKIFIVGFFLN